MALPVDNETRRSLVLGAVVAVSVAIAALGVAVTRALAGARASRIRTLTEEGKSAADMTWPPADFLFGGEFNTVPFVLDGPIRVLSETVSTPNGAQRRGSRSPSIHVLQGFRRPRPGFENRPLAPARRLVHQICTMSPGDPTRSTGETTKPPP